MPTRRHRKRDREEDGRGSRGRAWSWAIHPPQERVLQEKNIPPRKERRRNTEDSKSRKNSWIKIFDLNIGSKNFQKILKKLKIKKFGAIDGSKPPFSWNFFFKIFWFFFENFLNWCFDQKFFSMDFLLYQIPNFSAPHFTYTYDAQIAKMALLSFPPAWARAHN